ncbi:MAG: hypothetical protein FD163_2075 [Hyphomonadaceae bacterium]|nr:MAG: hypothetical protein FD163_2075 [Hyphomonadaceae bacterium]
METGARYTKLLEIAHETSSERRRELLHEVTDLFFESHATSTPAEQHMFGDLIGKVAFDLNNEVRKELSARFIGGQAPRNLALALADDVLEVAAPILQHTKSLTDEDLVKIVQNKGTHYQIAVSKRDEVSEVLSDALVTHGNDDVLTHLLRNEGAQISEITYDKVVTRAEANPDLHGPMVARKAIPPEVLNQLYSMVSGPMRKEILERNQNLSPEEVEAAMARARTKIGVQTGALPADFEAAQARLTELSAQGELDPGQLPNIWRSDDTTLFALAFAQIVGVDYFAISKLINSADVDGMAMLCRAKNFPRALFVSIAALTIGNNGMEDAAKLGHLYNEVPVEAAQRALRFMQIRTATAKAA